MLSDDGTLIVKFFLHISKPEQRRRFEKIEKQQVRVLAGDPPGLEGARAGTTSTGWPPTRCWSGPAPPGPRGRWCPSTDKRLRRVQVFETLVEAMEKALERQPGQARRPRSGRRRPPRSHKGDRTILDTVDLSRKLSPSQRTRRSWPRWQERLRELEFACYAARLPVIVAYEGWDAAGKGGAIRRLMGPLDPRGYAVIPIAAPKGDEATHHYLWRFWKRLPKAGHIAIFDRTWYGRVLVERVEGFCTRGRVAARLPRDQRVRALAHQLRHGAGQVLAARSRPRTSCSASRRARRTRPGATRSPTRTGATARSGTCTATRSAT